MGGFKLIRLKFDFEVANSHLEGSMSSCKLGANSNSSEAVRNYNLHA